MHNPNGWVDPLGLAGCPVFNKKSNRWHDSETGRFVRNPNATKSTGKALAPFYPPNRGFLGKSKKTVLQTGTMVDRYGFDGGTFVAPKDTPGPMRALPPGSMQKPYSVFEVQKPITVDGGITAPAFNQIGLGTQYELPGSVTSLLKSGALKRVSP